MLGKRRWLSLTLVAAVATTGLGVSVSAEPATESQFVAEINGSRAANGLPPLAVDGKLASYADTHTARMIAEGEIFHSTGSQLASAGSPGWTKLGENVGRGGTPSSLHHDAFMKSPTHRANILDPDFNYVGVGTAFDNDDVMYVTVVFMALPGSTTTTTSPPATTTTSPPATTTTAQKTTTTAPKATTSTTTATLPPTTTTTLDVGPDHPVTPGESCLTATRFWWMCHD
ncbi:MAG: CAP domain-containing protein [Acidimicrobiia bacterium]|nr:CAP domain-containing protein [Acidimicrobiia bacterium]